MRIFLIGAGNLGLVCAAKMAAHGDQVALFTGTPDKWTDVAAAEKILEAERSLEVNDMCMPIKQILELIPGTK